MTAAKRERKGPGTGTARFPAAERMRTDREYRDVVHRGERTNTPHFTVYRDLQGRDERKVGVSAGKRVGGSVLRNRIKRLVRECFRLNKDAFPAGSRTAVVVRKAPPLAGLAAVCDELLPAIRRRWGQKGEPASCGHGHSSSA